MFIEVRDILESFWMRTNGYLMFLVDYQTKNNVEIQQTSNSHKIWMNYINSWKPCCIPNCEWPNHNGVGNFLPWVESMIKWHNLCLIWKINSFQK